MNLLLSPRREESEPMMGRLARKAMFLVDSELQFGRTAITNLFSRASGGLVLSRILINSCDSRYTLFHENTVY